MSYFGRWSAWIISTLLLVPSTGTQVGVVLNVTSGAVGGVPAHAVVARTIRAAAMDKRMADPSVGVGGSRRSHGEFRAVTNEDAKTLQRRQQAGRTKRSAAARRTAALEISANERPYCFVQDFG